MYDAAGRGLVHINSLDCPRMFDRDVGAGPTRALHHMALNRTGYGEMIERFNRHARHHQLHEVKAVGLQQLFTVDPGGVLLELDYFGD